MALAAVFLVISLIGFGTMGMFITQLPSGEEKLSEMVVPWRTPRC